MTREDAKDYLYAIWTIDSLSVDETIALEMAIKALEQKPQTEWIPVEKQLPEPWASVLITFSGKYGKLIADHAVGTGSYDGSNGWFIDEIQGYTDRLTVDAWMNLPESYKGE